MKKIIFLSFSTFVLLAGCGNQNLLPLEEQSTKLQESNHELKLENQSLKNDNASKEKHLAALVKDTKDTKKARENHQIASYYEVSSKYYSDVTSIINAYETLDREVLENKRKEKVIEKLEAVIDDHELAVERYKDDAEILNVVEKDEQVKKQHKDVQNVQKTVHDSFQTIRKGYVKKDEKMIQEGRQKLTNIKVDTSDGAQQQ
ncbi:MULTISPECIES: hypothetical protein [unclassified Staphylococcus]|uniref:hypothetical protein n=1 Tax=unclassified Staphylococcus TaxID=91994 RepID=UPI0021CE8D77|nr:MULTISPECIES: hypothetical protein [unclassified Staphylococcus]UXR68686.1 hypothetical protein MUA26_05720 [Staphylococcus sp. IVB6246]UXR70743.1 hypothetical protein MUA88_05800 [Staphylococcus sp. IVB6240]UXR72974.1 hypothetical protein MUA48_05975 [Staphylococcus sp. IVB6238]UXR75269.1 hypothetical protein MUA74_06035 [Staphylococcus sp. IVB6233]UXR79470.1 hypothetical protein MUA65_05640 [Staphylococcus sp. IVB6218]